MITRKQIVKAIGCEGLDLFDAGEYYYFCYDIDGVYEEKSVMVPRVNDMSLDNWVDIGTEFALECME